MTKEAEKVLLARLAAAEAQIRALEARVRALEARNRPLGPKPGCWPGIPLTLDLKPNPVEPPQRFTSLHK